MSVERDLRGCRYAIVGGGMSGLAAAWYLQRRGAETHIFEREEALGGRTASGRLGEREVTLGGKNIGRAYSRFREFAGASGEHRFEYFGINSSRVLDGKLLTLDSNHRIRALANLRGVSGADLARLARLVLAVRRDPGGRFLGERSCDALAHRYRGASVGESFGLRLRELLLRSLTVRVSAAEPDEVPMANMLPYVSMITDTYDQLANGMHELVADAARRSRVHVGADVHGLARDGGHVSAVTTGAARGPSPQRAAFDGVVLATPAHAAARLLRGLAPGAATLLEQVRYFPVIALLAEYERPVFTTGVRATVFDADSALSNAGAYGPHALNVVRYTFSGRSARALAEREPDPPELAALAERALAPFADVDGNPRRALLARRFSPGLCAYHADQAGLLRGLRAELARLPGLAVTGDYLHGCSIEACFFAAEQAVGAIVAPASPRVRAGFADRAVEPIPGGR